MYKVSFYIFCFVGGLVPASGHAKTKTTAVDRHQIKHVALFPVPPPVFLHPPTVSAVFPRLTHDQSRQALSVAPHMMTESDEHRFELLPVGFAGGFGGG